MAGKQLNPYKKPYSEISKDLAPEDTAAVLDMTIAALKNLGGRPCTYPNTAQGLTAFITNSQGYFEYLQKVNSQLEQRQQVIPDIENYCVYLGICRSTLKSYNDRGGEWEKVIALFKEAILSNKKQLMLKGRIPAVLGVLDLVNNHGYYNTNSFVIETKAAGDKEKANDLEDKLNEAGLIWDPETHEYIPLERIEEDVD